MYGKLLITMILRVETGLHIGASDVYAAIGSVNNPIIRDPSTGLPIVPGSSIKGKMRSLLANAQRKKPTEPVDFKFETDDMKRVFGSASGKDANPQPARLQFADAFLINGEALDRRGGVTEVKFENTIKRLTQVADPRQLERIVKGAEFMVKLTYNVENIDEVQEDLKLIYDGLRMLSADYLGGSGSRGSGRISFRQIEIEPYLLREQDNPKLQLETLKGYIGEEHDGLHYLQT